MADGFVRNVGESWASNQVFGNHHYELLLKSGDKSEFFFKQLIEPPSNGIACLDFRYKKISSGLQLFLFDLFIMRAFVGSRESHRFCPLIILLPQGLLQYFKYPNLIGDFLHFA